MDPASEISKEIVVPIVKRLLHFVKEHLTYMICYKKNVDKMSSRIGSLEGRLKMVQGQVRTDEINSVPIQPDVTTWLKNAQDSLVTAKDISGEEDAVSKGCLNLKQRYNLGKGASDKLQEINNLLEEKLNIEFSRNVTPLGRVGSVVGAVSENAIHRLPSMVEMDGVAAFDSRKQVYENVLEVLCDDKTCRMAIYGMGGVGKTTMIKHLEKTAKEKHLFHWIVTATVTLQPSMYKIQQELADCMSLKFPEDSLGSRAKRLGEAFEKISKDEKGSKKILVILDDVWEALDLEQVGLSQVAAGFKIILTTRNKDVCTGMNVGADAIFKLEVLRKEESWNLFQGTVQIQNFTDPELKEAAEEIAKECAGLPLAIILTANTLKGKSKSKWTDTLQCLKNSDILQKLNAAVEKSFDYLEHNDTKEVFLLCCLFPEDHLIPIEELARYAKGLRLYKNIHSMDMEGVRNRTITCVEELTGVNLLLESEYEGFIKMHDIVRDFGINRAPNTESTEGKWLVNHSNMVEWPQQDSYKPYGRISLECSNMDQLPSDLDCPNLKLLKLTGNPSSEFPEEFYKGMEKLHVLHYQEMDYPLLPGGSHQVFAKLGTLSLHSCKLGDFSVIGNLKSLEILSFAGCGVEMLPAEIRNLSRLKLLDVTGCRNLRIEEGVVEKLVKLEELYMRSYRFTDPAYQLTDSNCAALNRRFEKLTALEFEFYENRVEARPAFFKKLKRFRISIGCRLEDHSSYGHIPFKNTLMLETNESQLLGCGIHELFKITQVLVFKVEGINCICNISNAEEYLSNLRTLKVEHCNEMVHIVDTQVMLRTPRPQHSFFRMLKVLKVWRCNKLKFVFSHSIVKGMSMLEQLDVRFCENMEEIMEYESEEEEEEEEEEEKIKEVPGASSRVVGFPNLRFLSLSNLRNLVNFCKTGGGAIQFPQLEEFYIKYLGKITSIFQQAKRAVSSTAATDFKSVMHPLFNQKVALPKLQLLEIKDMDNLREVWGSQYRSKDFNLCLPTTIRVERCRAMEVIFDLDFGDLDCYEITKEEEEGHSSLRDIKVCECGNFKQVWRMKGVSIDESQLLRTSWSRDQLELVKGSSTSVQKILCEGEIIKESQTENFEREAQAILFPSYLSRTFHKLETLSLESCRGVDVAFEIGELFAESGHGNGSQQVLFPHLKKLTLHGLRNMSHVWKWKWKRKKFLPGKPQLCIVGFQNLTSLKIVLCHKIKCLFSAHMAKHLIGLRSLDISHCVELRTIVSNKDQDDENQNKNKDEDEEEEEGGQKMKMEMRMVNATLFPQLESLKLTYLPNLMGIGEGGPNKILCEGEMIKESHTENFEREVQAILFPSYLSGRFHKLETLSIWDCRGVDVAFEIGELFAESGYGNGSQQVLFPQLKKLALFDLHNMSHVWKWKKLLPGKPQLCIVGFQNLTSLKISWCPKLKYLFSAHMAKHLIGLRSLDIWDCVEMRTIVSYKDQDDDNENKNKDEEEEEEEEEEEKIHVYSYDSEMGVFEVLDVDGTSNDNMNERVQSFVKFPKLREMSLEGLVKLEYIWKSQKWIVLEFTGLTKLSIERCHILKHVFTSSTVASFVHLQELQIRACGKMEAIVAEAKEKEEEKEGVEDKDIVFPDLKYLKLDTLRSLEGFCLQKYAFKLPSLDTLVIKDCPEITVFTSGNSSTPKLKVIDTDFGLCNVKEDPNTFITRKKQQGFEFRRPIKKWGLS